MTDPQFNSVHEIANLTIVQRGDVTISTDGFLSGAITLTKLSPVRLNMPAAWTTANLTFQVSEDGTTFRNLYDDAGSETTVTAAASRSIIVDPLDFIGVGALKIRSGTAASTVGQAATRVIEVVYRLV
jgi:hypothetical protein